jgi:hypothetical protein
MHRRLAVIVGALTFAAAMPRPAPALVADRQPFQVADLNSEQQDRQAVENAASSGRLHEDPERHALRQAVLNAANRVEASPCDTQQRQKLSDAFDAYQQHMQATAEDKVETLTLGDGRVIDVSRHFDNPVEDAWRFALTSTCEN